MRAKPIEACEDPAARLPLAGQAPGRAEQDERSARQVQASPMAGGPINDHQTPALGVGNRVSGGSDHQDSTIAKSPARPVGGPAAADDLKARGIQLGGQLRPGAAVDLHHGLPGTGEAVQQQSLSLDTREPHQALPAIQ